uniref:S1 motif domain-containing protein n=1 Tax=Haemonchus contortus TaxID=6289 RepID=A0A7I4YKA5_HAECO
MVEKITVNGRLTRVETKFAFIETPHGSVFCPLAAAIPPSEHVPNFSMRYHVGDIVRVIMVPQEGKNGCRWRAVKVRHLNPACEPTGFPDNLQRMQYIPAGPSGSNFPNNFPVITDKCVVVTNVSETLAFGLSDEFGSVFIPGAAFSAEEVTRLNSYLNIGDELLVSLRAQGDVNGCRWIATSATKPKKSREPLITGCGKIISLTKFQAVVWCPIYGEIKCTILSWTGGDGGMNAEWLDDLLHIGDSVLFTAIKRDGEEGWKAVKWTARGFRIGDDRVQLADSYTQTVISAPEISRRYIVPVLDEALSEKPTLRSVLS